MFGASRTSKRDVLAVAAIALVVRVAWVVAVHRPPGGLSDPLLYQRFAQGIARGSGYVSFRGEPTAYYPPGYPYFLGALQWLCDRIGARGSLPLAAGLAQSVLGATTAGAAVVAGRRLGRAVGARLVRPAGLGAGLALALWPNLVLYTGVLLSEPLFLAAFSVFLAAILRVVAADRGSRGALAVAAAALGVATLIRPQVLVVVPALAVAWLVARRPLRRSLVELAALAVGVVVLLTPWTIRNLVVLDAFVPLSNNGGDNLCVGFHPGASGGFQVPAWCDTGEFYIDGPAAELRRDAETARRARRWALDHLGALPALSARKLWYTYDSDRDGLRALESYEQDPFLGDGPRMALRIVVGVGYVVIMGAALAGGAGAVVRLARQRGREPVVASVLAMTAASALIPVAFFGDPRFKVPSTPLFALLAGLAVAWLAGRRTRDQPPPGSMASPDAGAEEPVGSTGAA